jgi:hypothetical protein
MPGIEFIGRLRSDLLAVARDRGVTLCLGEGFFTRPDADVRQAASDLDLMRDLGVAQVNIIGLEPDRNRGLDQLATFAEMAKGGATAQSRFSRCLAAGRALLEQLESRP